MTAERDFFMNKYSGILICTDLDGTLLRNDKTISDENKAAIEYFKAEGGLFTFVTGRMPFFVENIYNEVNPNAPIGCVNGGGLYDYDKREYLWRASMPEEVTELIRDIDESFPEVGIQVNTYENVYFSKDNEVMENFRRITGVERLVCDYDKINEPIGKIVFGSDKDEEVIAVSNRLKSHKLAGKFGFIRSEMALYEILPKGVNKGTALKKLLEYRKINPNKTIAIGDYNNDIAMFKAAGVGIAVSNACSDALSVADYVTVSNEENAIAEVIYNIEKYLPISNK